METGENTYRRLYGRGGLSDQLTAMTSGVRGLRGLGDLAPGQFIPLLGYDASRAMDTLVRNMQAADTQLPAGPSPAPTVLDVNCDCIIGNIDVTPEIAAQLRSICANNPQAFAQTMISQGIPLDCEPEWYLQPRNIAIGVGVLAIGALAWWAL